MNEASNSALPCSIVIPAYNAVKYAESAVKSALEQNGFKAEIIVVDDGSTDGTAESLMQLDNVRLIRQENMGKSIARMEGLRHATSRFIVFLDADDELEPNAIAAHVAAMDAEPEAVMVFGSNRLINESGTFIGMNCQTPFISESPDYIARCVTPSPSQCMYRRRALDLVGGFDVSLEHCEDIDLNIKMSKIGRIVCHGESVARYRLHPEQATKRPSKVCKAHLFVLERHFGRFATSPDLKTLKSCERKWQRYYGQFIPSEIFRYVAGRRFRDASSAFSVFFSCLPQSFFGAVAFVKRRLTHR
ncbi:glycosyltransferase family 2 protein [Rhodosalinus sp. FB01]|uniref:glycosyltransferase family 2 protein n=1 Tax=Rhodosalinus sp. FB01 TaxID=3239194 RepID=UPI0035252C50